VNGCAPNTPRCAEATIYTQQTPPCCREHTRRLVHEVGAALTAAGVTWWLDYGSLLGAVRNPLLGLPAGMIPHDKDADLGFLGKDWPKVLGLVEEWRPELSLAGKPNRVGYALGFQWVHKLPRAPISHPGGHNFAAGDSVKVRLSATNHSNVDLFPWYGHPWRRSSDGKLHRYHFVGVDRCKGREFPAEKLLPLGEMEWEGATLPAPADPEWFCEHRYGKRWMTPIRRNNDGVRR
jgi:hypothetical protein